MANDVNLQLTRVVSIDFCASVCDTVYIAGVLFCVLRKTAV